MTSACVGSVLVSMLDTYCIAGPRGFLQCVGAVGRRGKWTAGCGVGLILAGGTAVYVYDATRADRLGQEVRIAGLPVGGMTPSQAREVVDRGLRAVRHTPVTVTRGGRQLVLTPPEARVRIAVQGAVESGVRHSRAGNPLTRTARALLGSERPANLAPLIGYSRPSVRKFVHRAAHQFDRPARDATVRPQGVRLRRLPGRNGVKLNTAALESQIVARLTSATGNRSIPAPMTVASPEVTLAELPDRYARFLTVDRKRFRLRFYRRLRLVRTYTISVGRVGFDTPAGLYRIQNKAVDPPWSVPDKPWAGSLAGQIIPSGSSQNPIKARWMGFFDGAGLHGTDETGSLGTAASHGCLRMSIPEVKALYRQVPVGTPIYIG